MQRTFARLSRLSGHDPNSAGLALTAAYRGHEAYLAVAGELDLGTCDSLTRAAVNALRPPVCTLLIDLDGVTFCGAAGVTALLGLHRAATRAGIRLTLTGIRPPVQVVLDLVQLGAVIPIVPAPEPLRLVGRAGRSRSVTLTSQ